jgi:hypothetical protein
MLAVGVRGAGVDDVVATTGDRLRRANDLAGQRHDCDGRQE